MTKTIRGKLPSLPFARIKNGVLGTNYRLSLVFAGSYRMRNLNSKYRKKTYTPNVLSFPLGRTEGEIFINPDRVRIEAKQHGLSPRTYTALLFIHGLFHLKGMRHGATMEKHEQHILAKYRIR